MELVLIMEKMLPRIPEQISSSLCWRRCRWMWCRTTGSKILRDSEGTVKGNIKRRQSEMKSPVLGLTHGYLRQRKHSAFVSPGKKNRRLSTVRAMDCSLTTSIDCPMSTVLGMLPKVPLTYSATSWTVNICSSSSNISGKLFNSVAWGGGEQRTQRNIL